MNECLPSDHFDIAEFDENASVASAAPVARVLFCAPKDLEQTQALCATLRSHVSQSAPLLCCAGRYVYHTCGEAWGWCGDHSHAPPAVTYDQFGLQSRNRGGLGSPGHRPMIRYRLMLSDVLAAWRSRAIPSGYQALCCGADPVGGAAAFEPRPKLGDSAALERARRTPLLPFLRGSNGNAGKKR